MRILVVDDEPLILTMLQAVFERAGYEVRTAPAADAAIALCDQERFDVVLSDIRMPGMNGHDLARWVAANRPETKVALMSAFEMKCEDCPVSPPCALLRKPFRPDQVVELIEKLAG